MKTRIFDGALLTIAGVMLGAILAPDLMAQGASTSPAAPGVSDPASISQNSAVPLSYGVEDVLRLVRAKVDDDTVIAFIQNSGRTYNLSAAEIVYLQKEGASGAVLTAMLNQRSRLVEAAAAQKAATVPAAAVPPSAASAEGGVTASGPTYIQSPASNTQTPPASTSASTVYVIPNSSPTVYYGAPAGPYYDGYYGYYGYPYSGVSLSFGFGSYYPWGYYGGGCYPGGWYGGYRGGYYCGGGYSSVGYRSGGYSGGGNASSTGYRGGGSPGGGMHGGGAAVTQSGRRH